MPLRDPKLLCQPTVDYLVAGKRPSWEIEEELAVQFKVTKAERAEIHPNSGCPVWRNDVAFALKRLREYKVIGLEKRTSLSG
jgi:hypothetical protein